MWDFAVKSSLSQLARQENRMLCMIWKMADKPQEGEAEEFDQSD